MERRSCTILENLKIAKDTYKLVFQWEDAKKCNAGQFFNILVDGFFLPRPISICEVLDDFNIAIIYKVVGEGTAMLSKKEKGSQLIVMGPLGNGYTLEDKEEVLLMGGGAGVPPMIELAKRYIEMGAKVRAFLGFANEESIFGVDRLIGLGVDVEVTTDDGSYGAKGNVVDRFNKLYGKNVDYTSFVCACGPEPMLRAIEKKFKKGYISFESRMACGLGACMACVAKDKKEEELYHRICKEGPVFPIGRLSY